METAETTLCIHRWRYFVDLRSRAIRVRRCEVCGVERPLAVEQLPLTA